MNSHNLSAVSDLDAFLLPFPLPPGGAFSHHTAARTWGMILPEEFDPTHPPHVTVNSPHRMRTNGSYIGHSRQLPDSEKTSLRSLPVTTPERTWFDMIGWAESTQRSARNNLGVSLRLPGGVIYPADTLEYAVAWGDRLIGGSYPVSTRAKLQSAVEKGHGARGAKIARAALPLLNESAQSAGDSLLTIQLTHKDLPPGPPITLVGNTVPRSILYPLTYPSARIALRFTLPPHLEAHHFLSPTSYQRVGSWKTLSFNDSDVCRRGTVLERLIDCAAGVMHPSENLMRQSPTAG
ncbi:hypothetical protein [Lysinibacter sp. HNR]|uniref:hypothetical protein n=1 Tax=Lysinibacter sp. HNR TaxID=3031408 RepID=UPI002435A07B|nr:hypothetical protein [Lysinibacter sp. HNR]WGD38367.1 hypothetical protein FrondiHNR_05500 [Lysinibacter sp. HNR]